MCISGGSRKGGGARGAWVTRSPLKAIICIPVYLGNVFSSPLQERYNVFKKTEEKQILTTGWGGGGLMANLLETDNC